MAQGNEPLTPAVDTPIQEVPAPSRRKMLAGAIGGLGAFLAGSLARAPKAEAANGDALLIGRVNSGTASPTELNVTGAGEGLRVRSGNTGILGQSTGSSRGVIGTSHDGIGLLGNSFGTFDSSVGVVGFCAGSDGVRGNSTDGNGVKGHSRSGPGVKGESENSDGVFGFGHHGYGVHGVSELSVAIYGRSEVQTAILGVSDERNGVFGRSERGTGVSGYGAGHSIGVLAQSAQGLGLKVVGLVEFKTSGFASIPAGSDQVVVSVEFDLSDQQRIVATMNSDPGNAATVHWIEMSPGPNEFTIHVTEAVDNKTAVAWFVIGNAPGQ